jgi:redox-sensing transcriptional repressor
LPINQATNNDFAVSSDLSSGLFVFAARLEVHILADMAIENSNSMNDPHGDSSGRASSLPPATANRLGMYLRELQHFLRSGAQTIKSHALGHRLGLSDSQIRRDLALFGEFGKRGVGYDVSGLVHALRRALGTDGQWNAILLGLGNLGSALIRYPGFRNQGFVLQAVFDADISKVGVPVEGVPVHSIDDLEQVLPDLSVQLAILAVPAPEATKIAIRLADLGISGILNFADVNLSQVSGVAIVDVDLSIELQRLAFAVVNSDRSS